MISGPKYYPIDIGFEPYVGTQMRSTGVFVKAGRPEPITGNLGKNWWPEDSPRQPYFEQQVRRIAEHFRNRCVPVHFEWATGEKNQLDKGCIGHSFAGEVSFIESIARNNREEITHIILRDLDAQN